ncbi:MAG TPA: ABC transporter substrate-binding protein [Acidimicrobiales bacterium]|nr:ABC transporter substrate-binding protein [Acidimicrobiales bacterium]
MRFRLLALVMALSLVAAGCGTRVTGTAVAARNASAGSTGSDASGASGGDSSLSDPGASSSAAGGDLSTAVGGKQLSAGGASSAGAAATGPSDPGVTDNEIRIGASGPLSGVAGFLGEEAFGAIDSYFQTINAQGGINGRKLKLITYDDRFDSSQTLANVQRLYEQDHVVGIFLAFGDPVADYVTRNKIPTLVFGVTPKSFSSKYPTVFPLVGNALLWTQEVIVGLKQMGVFKQGMRVGILYDTQILDVTPYVPFLKQSWENAGAKVVSTDPFNFSDGDCTSLVLKMRQMQIDYWDFQGLGWVLCASAASRQGYRPPIGWGDWPTSVAGLASQVGPWVAGMWGGDQGDQPDGKPRTKTAATAEYVNAISRYHPNIATVGHLESPATIGYYVGAKLLVAALKAQGKTITKAGINDWISKVQNFDPGITPPIISMAPNCKTGSEIVWIGRWKWDSNKNEATRVPETGYFTSDQKEKFGGKCFLTKMSDSFS